MVTKNPINELFNYLDSVGLLSIDNVDKIIPSLSLVEISRLTQKTYSYINNQEVDSSGTSLFNFSICSTLCGVGYCCQEIGCRIRRISEMLTFSSMYSDTVYIPNFIEPIPEDIILSSEWELDTLYYHLISNYTALLMLKPFMKARIVKINNQTVNMCDHCFSTHFKKLIKLLRNDLKDKIEFKIEKDGSIHISQKQRYLDVTVLVTERFQKRLKSYSKFPHTFSFEEVVELKLFEEFLGPVTVDVLSQGLYSSEKKLSYLTNRKIDQEIIEILNPVDAAGYDNSIDTSIYKLLTHQVPFITNVNPVKILQLRLNDGSAFLTYRDALTSAMNNLNRPIATGDSSTLVNDMLLPEVNKIQRVVDIHKKDLEKNIKRKILFTAATISTGALAVSHLGIHLSEHIPETAGIAVPIGYQMVRDLYQNVTASRDIPKEAQQNNYYFLWEVKNR